MCVNLTFISLSINSGQHSTHIDLPKVRENLTLRGLPEIKYDFDQGLISAS